MPDYTWITDAPIFYVQPNEVEKKIQQFEKNLEGWELKEPSSGEGKKWNDRVFATGFILELMRKKPADAYFEYRMDGQPIALMGVRASNPVEIKWLATHPGSENAGGIMVEHALFLANNKLNYGPVLVLESYNADSTKAYQALGFRVLSGTDMELDASRCPLWTSVNERWKLKKYLGMKLLSTT
jgi:hypothetical protein